MASPQWSYRPRSEEGGSSASLAVAAFHWNGAGSPLPKLRVTNPPWNVSSSTEDLATAAHRATASEETVVTIFILDGINGDRKR